jgi:hypothetical protein
VPVCGFPPVLVVATSTAGGAFWHLSIRVLCTAVLAIRRHLVATATWLCVYVQYWLPDTTCEAALIRGYGSARAGPWFARLMLRSTLCVHSVCSRGWQQGQLSYCSTASAALHDVFMMRPACLHE